MPTIGFIGLGNMGAPMAANLVKSGGHVRGFDIVPAARDASARDGVQIVANARSAVEDAEVIITMLPGGEHVLAVWNDIVPRARQGTLFIDCSTIDVASARKAHALAAARGIATLDAPVSGGVGGAKAATLTFMVGGSEHAFARGKPVLEHMGKRIVHCGEAGNGQVAKICNNLILGASMIAVSEAFVLGEKLGLSHQALFDVVSGSSGQCWSLTSYCPVPGPVPASPANNDYQAGFTAALMLKDLNLAKQAAQSAGVAAALGAHAGEIYAQFAEQGRSAQDFSAIVNLVREQSKSR
jgi:3-hydroxyisobutyrate dehydrogenase